MACTSFVGINAVYYHKKNQGVVLSDGHFLSLCRTIFGYYSVISQTERHLVQCYRQIRPLLDFADDYNGFCTDRTRSIIYYHVLFHYYYLFIIYKIIFIVSNKLVN